MRKRVCVKLFADFFSCEQLSRAHEDSNPLLVNKRFVNRNRLLKSMKTQIRNKISIDKI